MKFTVQNLGRLVEATIDLDKDLILFVGPNNTSKTYVAHTLYGLFSRLPALLTECIAKALPSSTGLSSSIDVDDILGTRFAAMIATVEDRYRSELSDVLASSEDFTARARISLFGFPAELSDTISAAEFDAETTLESQHHFLVRKQSGDLSAYFELIPASTEGPSASAAHGGLHIMLRQLTAIFLAGFLATTTYDSPQNVHVLTAERAAIQLFSRELSAKRSALIDELLKLNTRSKRGQNDLAAMLQQNARRYPAPIRDSLELANDLSTYRKQTSKFAALADILDQQLIGGALHIGEDGDLLFQPDKGGTPLPLTLASSSVKALAGLSFHLRHLVSEGDVLIIDEPELNLHPDNQRRVARVLARLARGGVKVIITTHSDYIVRELNNLIMLSADEAGDLRERHGYVAEETLTPAQVGAYRFDSTHAHPLEVKPTGIEVETIDREINALNRVSQDIYFSLFDKA